MAYKLLYFATDAALAESAAADWLTALRNRTDSAIPYNVALSGGRIVKTFFAEIVRQSESSPALFQNVHFFWADERCVPPGDPESNYALARQLLFEPLKIPETQIHRLRGEGPELLALREGVGDVCMWASVVNGQPVLDMIFLGMGEDGHVASLFPGELEEVMRDAAIYRAVTAVKPPPRRVTLGYAVIAAALEVWVIVSGSGKQGALKESLSPAGKTPLARVLSQRAETTILTDVAPG